MIETGINYVSTIPSKVISDLARKGVIDVLKFPGVRCTLDEQEQFIKNIPANVKGDIHGLINFKPAWNEAGIAQQTRMAESNGLFIRSGCRRFSTHIGCFPGTKNLMENFKENRKRLNKILPVGNFGGENVYSLVDEQGNARYMTLETTSPEFINQMWSCLDFGVFDIAHAKIAARDHRMSFMEYVERLDKERVEIIHISGGENNVQTGNLADADPHMPCTLEDFLELRRLLPYFPNVNQVISELAYSKGKKGERISLKVSDYQKEAEALHIAVTKSEEDLKAFFATTSNLATLE